MKVIGLIMAVVGGALIYMGYTGKSWKEVVKFAG